MVKDEGFGRTRGKPQEHPTLCVSPFVERSVDLHKNALVWCAGFLSNRGVRRLLWQHD